MSWFVFFVIQSIFPSSNFPSAVSWFPVDRKRMMINQLNYFKQVVNTLRMGLTPFTVANCVTVGSPVRFQSRHFGPFVSNSQLRRLYSIKSLLQPHNQTRLVMQNEIQNKPRILGLHGFRTSALIFKNLIARWPDTVLKKLDIQFLDGPFPAQGKSEVEGFFDPPYYEWYQANQVRALSSLSISFLL